MNLFFAVYASSLTPVTHTVCVYASSLTLVTHTVCVYASSLTLVTHTVGSSPTPIIVFFGRC